MTELKTLKDIEKLIVSEETHILYNALKQEAIKWVKNCDCFSCLSYCSSCSRFIFFFNLTSKDLK